MKTYSFLQDKRFLHELFSLRIKEQFIKITVLNWKEEPLEQIQGITISGNINLDGSSSMRRTASLSIFAEQKKNNLANIDNLFSINKKCIIQIGFINNVSKYTFGLQDENKKIIFHTIDYQKLYGDIVWFPLGVYVMFNPSIAHSLTGVTISMQLKDKMCLLNGDLGGQIHSGVTFTEQDEIVDKNSLSIEKNPVLVYNLIKQLVHHWGNEQLSKIIISEVPLRIKKVVRWLGDQPIYLVDNDNSSYTLEVNKPEGKSQVYQKYDDIGFQYSEFTYPGELTCNAGQTVTSVLDKIIGILGNYQYFYDIFGNFVFQEKQNNLNMTNVAYWDYYNHTQQNQLSKVDLPVDQYEVQTRLTKSVYNFSGNEYIISYNNTLNYNNIKNDFVVWGNRKGTNGIQTLCRFHLAVDKKPSLNTHTIALYEDDFQTIRGISFYGQEPPAIGSEITWIDSKYTIIWSGEHTSIDWREQIYYQMLESEKYGTDANTELNNSYFQYYAQLKEEFPKIFDLQNQQWKIDILNHPDQINYYLDFIDQDSFLGQYSVNNIGRRSKIIGNNNQGINCVFEPFIPDIVYIDTTKYSNQKQVMNIIREENEGGQKWTLIQPYLSSLFDIDGRANSCYEKIKDLLYQYTHVNNTISISGLPIYYLEPNTRITVEDAPGGIEGDYIIQSISLPLDISSTMSINAYKALQKI